MRSIAVVESASADRQQLVAKVRARGRRRLAWLATSTMFGSDERIFAEAINFLTAERTNVHTQRSYALAAKQFGTWCERHGVVNVRQVQPAHFGLWLEELAALGMEAASRRVRLAGVRALFDALVRAHLVQSNPADASRVSGSSNNEESDEAGTQALTRAQARRLLDSIAVTRIDAGGASVADPLGLRDRAILATMLFTFCRVGAVAKLRECDVLQVEEGMKLRLHEKNNKRRDKPVHHQLEGLLDSYRAVVPPAPPSPADSKPVSPPLFRSAVGNPKRLSDRGVGQPDVYRMIQRRMAAAGIKAKACCHSFRATGITEYLKAGGQLEVAQQMANHSDARTTKLYDKRKELDTRQEFERLSI